MGCISTSSTSTVGLGSVFGGIITSPDHDFLAKQKKPQIFPAITPAARASKRPEQHAWAYPVAPLIALHARIRGRIIKKPICMSTHFP
jgi:hypothetical protein